VDAQIAKTISEHQALLLMVTELQARQNVTNQMVLDGMRALNSKMEAHDVRFSNMEHQTREFLTIQNMVRELLDRTPEKRP